MILIFVMANNSGIFLSGDIGTLNLAFYLTKPSSLDSRDEFLEINSTMHSNRDAIQGIRWNYVVYSIMEAHSIILSLVEVCSINSSV